uniref:Uncharacterized protein n=1 Tax=Tanacetum cinerariifolium TaxID=118510 RepID=A0A6L2LCQ0_TANCI|nr:hypothetical protein [Tanacetum cinerariifolium]
MTRSSNTKVFTSFANLERQFQSRIDITPITVHNIYSFCKSESSESKSEDLSDIDIETHTLVLGIKCSKAFPLLAMKIPLLEHFTTGEGSATPTKLHHTPSPQEQHSPHHDASSPSYPTVTTEPIPQSPTKTPTETPTLRRYTRRAIRIAQSKALSPTADKPASLFRDDRQGEAFLTVSSLAAGQDKENINKTSALPHESSLRSQMAAKLKDQDLEITGLKERVKFLEDNDRGSAEPTQEDAPIKGGIIEIGEEVGAEKSTELGRNNTEEMVNVLSSIEAANILTNKVAAASVSPAAGVSTTSVPTVSGSFPTVSAIFTTASVVTPYTRRPKGITIGGVQQMTSLIIGAKDKGKQKVIESEVPKKRKIQEQIDAQVAKEMEEEFARENQRSNEVIAKHLREYEQAEAESSVGEKIELINELEIHSEGKREYWKIIRLGGHIAVYQFFVDMLKQFDREDLHQLWTLVKETFSIRHATKDKEKELGVELKRLFEPDFEDQLWTHNQAFMHDPLDWKLYDTCGVYHVST